MLPYLETKVVEYSVVLSWLSDELQDIESKRPDRHKLVTRLRALLSRAQQGHKKLNAIVNSGVPNFAGRGIPIIHEIGFYIAILSAYHLPALRQVETEASSLIRKLLTAASLRCGLDWIEDIAIRLDGTHATVAFPTETPVIFAPPHQAVSLPDMPGLYHELGHNVFQRFRDIATELSQTVHQFYSELRQQSGPLHPNQRRVREHQLDEALEYWSIKRLEELFCDIFATLVCGPAHYFSCADMGIRTNSEAFDVDLTDAHPPISARVYVCYASLLPSHRTEFVAKFTHDLWSNHEKNCSRNTHFEQTCSEELMNRIVVTSISCIQKLLPQSRRYSALMPPDHELNSLSTNISLEDLLNRAIKLLLTQPTKYASWEAKALDMLRSS